MSSRTETWVAGIVGVAVGALLAVTIFLVSQPPAAREQATGAIGAAERFKAEQIKEGDTGIAGFAGSADQFSTTEVAQLLGKAVAERQAWELDKASDVLAKSMWENASPAERITYYVKADTETQRRALDRMDESGRLAFQKAVEERASGERAANRAAGLVSKSDWAKVSNELAKSMWENASALEKITCYVKADTETQRRALDRMDENGRDAFQRILGERATGARIGAERAEQ